MKVIFLDIDGVVNCQTTMQRHRGTIGIDPYKAFTVARLVERVDAKVVLSSTWRLWEDARAEVRKQVCKFIDVTPRLYRDLKTNEIVDDYDRDKGGVTSVERGHEIKTWLDAHPEVTDYAILDDSGDMLPEQQAHFFQTSWEKGITEEIAKRVEEHFILNEGKCPACVAGIDPHRNCVLR